jgi:SAM-dependent methyltransferase
MHEQATQFTLFVKRILPEYFEEKRVLDVGSGDINGNNRFLFKHCGYEGNDVIHGKNVTIVSKTKDLPSEYDDYFDVIVSTECFEHDPDFPLSIQRIYTMLKPDGLFFFTCASTGRQEHGTRRTSPQDSFGTMGNIEDMIDHYKNITEHDLNKVLELKKHFVQWNTYFNAESKDLYFVGIKNGIQTISPLEVYTAPYVFHTSGKIETVSL